MSKQSDYGYFGKGITGYVQYKTAFDRNANDSAAPDGAGSNAPHNNGNSHHSPKRADYNYNLGCSGTTLQNIILGVAAFLIICQIIGSR